MAFYYRIETMHRVLFLRSARCDKKFHNTNDGKNKTPTQPREQQKNFTHTQQRLKKCPCTVLFFIFVACKTLSPIFSSTAPIIFCKIINRPEIQIPHFPRRATRNCRLRRQVARRGSTVAQDCCSSVSSKLHPATAPPSYAVLSGR